VPVCTQARCPELVPRYGYCELHRRERNRKRNADPRRLERYGPGSGWDQERRAALEAQPWCGVCGTVTDLTVDHDPSGARNVWCRSCHSREEARRRAEVKASR
jgi:hypothetical protein